MIDIERAMDSMKFNVKLDQLGMALKKKGLKEEEKKIVVQEFFEAAAPFFLTTPKVKKADGVKPKRTGVEVFRKSHEEVMDELVELQAKFDAAPMGTVLTKELPVLPMKIINAMFKAKGLHMGTPSFQARDASKGGGWIMSLSK